MAHVCEFGFEHDRTDVHCLHCEAGGRWSKWPQWKRREHYEREHPAELKRAVKAARAEARERRRRERAGKPHAPAVKGRNSTYWRDHPNAPLDALDVTPDGRVLHWMAFDPEYGPESEAQVEWHRRQYGDDHVRGWTVGLPLPGCTSEEADRRRDLYQSEMARPPSAQATGANDRLTRAVRERGPIGLHADGGVELPAGIEGRAQEAASVNGSVPGPHLPADPSYVTRMALECGFAVPSERKLTRESGADR